MTHLDEARLHRIVPGDLIRALSRVEVHRSLFAIAVEWAGIVAAVALVVRHPHPLLYLVSIAFIGARQHNLAILVHEGAHFRLARSRQANEWLSDLFCAFPLLLVTTARYRANHFLHHHHLNTAQDPDLQRKQTPEWKFPRRRRDMVLHLCGQLCGVGIVNTLRISRGLARGKQDDHAIRAANRARLLFVALVALTLTLTSTWFWFLAFWFVPLFTWTQLLLNVRSIAEHFAIPNRPGFFRGTRTTYASLLDRAFFAAAHVGFHVEHHLFPSVPCYNLAKLHRELMQIPEYASHVHITRGYARVVAEAVR